MSEASNVVQVEALIGAVAVGFGATCVFGLPPPWMPAMPAYLVHAGVVFGCLLLMFGSWLLLMACCRYLAQLPAVIAWWESMLSLKWVARAVSFATLVVFCLPLVMPSHGQSPPQSLTSFEDLRVSVHITPTGKDELKAVYLFRNLGMHTALVNGVNLLEIVRRKGFDNPQDNFNFCDSVKADTLLVLNTVAPMMGRGSQVGDDDQKISEYDATTPLIVDEIVWDKGGPIPIEGEKTRFISAKFMVKPSHRQNFNVLVFCPMISTSNIKDLNGVAICRGIFLLMKKISVLKVNPHSNSGFCQILLVYLARWPRSEPRTHLS